jgi:hypothetical protein
MMEEKLRLAAESLRKHLEIAVNPQAFSIGLADEELHVYIHRRLYKKITPDEWEGFRVETIYVGQVRPAGAKQARANCEDE